MKCQRCGYICYETEAICRNCGWHHDVVLIQAFRGRRSVAELERDRAFNEIVDRVMEMVFGEGWEALAGRPPCRRRAPAEEAATTRAVVLSFELGRRDRTVCADPAAAELDTPAPHAYP